MADDLGAAKLSLIIDMADWDVAIQRGKNSLSNLSSDSAQAFNNATHASKRAATSLADYVAYLGKTADQTRLLRAAKNGVDPAAIAAAAEQMRAFAEASAHAENEQRQLAAALAQMRVGEGIVAELREQIATFGMGKNELTLYRAAMAGVQSEALPLISTLDRLNREQEIAGLRAQASAAAFQQQIAAASGYTSSQHAAEQATRRRADAEAAFLPLLEREAELNKAATTRGEFLRQLDREAKTIGKTRSELMEMRAAELGLTQAAAPLIAKLREQEQALLKNGRAADQGKKALNAYGISQKQFEFAMRGVPAQMTDIFVSLQGGQNPLTVFLQQGGQLKDMFGGIKPAAAALGGELLKLVNIYTVSAAVVTTLAIAAYKGSQETNQFGKALALTGNAAGVTANQMSFMAAEMDRAGTSTQASASRALAEVARTGTIASRSFQDVAAAADAMYLATGKAIDDTVSEFKKIAEDPVATIQELNKAQHFLTVEIYDQIVALQQQGRTTEAAALAMKTYADATITAANRVSENLGLLEKAWKYVKIGASEAWDEMMGIGRNLTAAQELQKLIADNQRDLNNIANASNARIPGSEDAVPKLRADVQKRYDRIKELNQQMEAERVTAEKTQARQSANELAIANEELIRTGYAKEVQLALAVAEQTQKINDGIAKAKLAGDIALAERLESQRSAAIAAISKKYEDKSKKTSTRESFATQNNFELQALRDQLALEKSTIQTSQQLNQAAYSNKQITAEEYYRRQKELIQQSVVVETASLEKQIDYLKSANGNKREAINNQRQLGELETRLAQLREKSGTELKLLSGEEARYYQERQYSIEDYKRSLTDATEAIQRDYALRAAAIGMSAREAEIQGAVNDVYVRQTAALRDLTTQRDRGVISADEFAQKSAALANSSTQQIAAIKGGNRELLVAQQDWAAGMRAGMQDWIDNATLSATSVANIMGSTLDTLTEGMTNAALTGKLAMKDMLADIGRELTKFFMRKAVMQFAEMFAGAFMGGGADFNSGYTGMQGINAELMKKNAKGNVYNSPSLSAYSNGVFSSPQVFAFAKGAGVFGEAGPEAIMPLARTSNGDLGVQMAGGGAGVGDVNIDIQVNVAANGETTADAKSNVAAGKELAKQMANVANKAIQDAVRPNGALWKIGVGR